jgi:predicted negative regulator of RcsB-dependent stress response
MATDTTTNNHVFNVREALQSPSVLKTIAIALTVILVIGGIAAAISTLQKRKDSDLQEQYYQYESQVLKIQETLEKDKKPLTIEDFGNTVNDLSQFVKSHPNSVAGQMGALLLSSIYTKVGNTELAYESLSTIKPVGEMGAMVQYRKLNLLADQGKYQEVITLSDSLLKSDLTKLFHPEIRLTKALALLELGQKDAAVSELQVIVDSKLTDGSQIVQKAKKYIRLVKSESL